MIGSHCQRFMKTIVSLLVILFIQATSQAATIVVANTNDSGLGSLRQAIFTSVNGDTIRFDPSLIASGSDTILLNSGINFSKGLVFVGLYNSTDTLYISGQDITRIFVADLLTTSTLTLVLDSMCFVNGYHPVSGGAVDFRGDKLEVRNCRFYNNRAISFGGAIQAIARNSFGYWTVEVNIFNTIIRNNLVYSASGGGVNISAQEEAVVNIIDSDISYNQSLFGSVGGLLAFSSTRSTTMNVINSTINNNSCAGAGAGLYVRSVSNSQSPSPVDSIRVNLINSSICNNTAESVGGGFYSSLLSNYDNCSYLIKIENCKINNNSSLDNGGGIYSTSNNTINTAQSADIHIIDSELKDNTALNGGGAYINSDYTVPGGVSLRITNSTVTGNTSTNFGGGIYQRGYFAQLMVDKSTISDNSSADGGGVYFVTRYRSPIFNKAIQVNKSTVSGNIATTGGGIYVGFTNPDIESVKATYSTIYNNSATTGGAIFASSVTSIAPYTLKFKSSIIATNGANAIAATNLQSLGHNIFSNAVVSGSVATDQLGIDSLTLNLGPLQINGGLTPTHMPNLPSPAIDMGDPLELSAAQNWPITGIRESGAAEVASIAYDTLTISVCDSLLSPSGNYTWYADGIYSDTLFGTPTDSLFTINLTIQNPNSTIVENNCSGTFTTPNGTLITSSGIYYDTIPSASGCDSIITYIVTFYAPTFSTINVNACSEYTSPSGILWTSSGTYSDTIINSNGCDSIITINLSIDQTFNSYSVVTCTSPFIAPSGVAFTNSGVYTDTILNTVGCDSILTIDLTINSPSFATLNEVSCNPYSSPSGQLYMSNGTYLDTIPNAVGCDSVITINLTLQESFSSITESICTPSFIAPSGQVFTNSGIYSDTIPNVFGCDSVITIDLTINAPTTSSITATECELYVSPSGQVFTNSGIYFDTVPNSFGCDSIISIDLTIIQVNTVVTNNDPVLDADAGATSYQWLDCNNGYTAILGETSATFTPQQNGLYAVEVEMNGCIDTSTCVAVNQVSLFELNASNWTVYPNPTSDKVTINFEESLGEIRVEISDPLGQIIRKQLFENVVEIELFLGDESGLYFVRVLVNGGGVMLPVVKL